MGLSTQTAHRVHADNLRIDELRDQGLEFWQYRRPILLGVQSAYIGIIRAGYTDARYACWQPAATCNDPPDRVDSEHDSENVGAVNSPCRQQRVNAMKVVFDNAFGIFLL